MVIDESPAPGGTGGPGLVGTTVGDSSGATDGSVPGLPGDVPAARYRCRACGNLTRFDVVVQRRTRAFHHFSVGGDLSVEDVEVLAESVEEVSCRWCGHGDAVEVLPASSTDDG